MNVILNLFRHVQYESIQATPAFALQNQVRPLTIDLYMTYNRTMLALPTFSPGIKRNQALQEASSIGKQIT